MVEACIYGICGRNHSRLINYLLCSIEKSCVHPKRFQKLKVINVIHKVLCVVMMQFLWMKTKRNFSTKNTLQISAPFQKRLTIVLSQWCATRVTSLPWSTSKYSNTTLNTKQHWKWYTTLNVTLSMHLVTLYRCRSWQAAQQVHQDLCFTALLASLSWPRWWLM